MAGDVRIAVAMTTFNGTAFLADQLNSMAAQTRVPDLLVINDDASVDGTQSLLTAVTADFPFRVELNMADQRAGTVANIERAIARCECDIIVLADQDDVWHDDRLAVIERVF